MNIPRFKKFRLIAIAAKAQTRLAIFRSNDLTFALRTTAASLIALYIAFQMNMDDPAWAPATVWIVAQANRGMGISKSQYRILGTAVGAIFALGLVAAFAQTPVLCLLALALWVGLCTTIATCLRNFRAYAAVLAGYTAAIIALSAISAPEQAFDIAISRFLYITVGILAGAVLTTLFVPDTALRDLRISLSSYIACSAKVIARILRSAPDDQAVHRLLSDALDLDTTAEYVASESPDARHITGQLRSAVLAILRAHAAAQTINEYSTRHDTSRLPVLEDVTALLDNDAMWTAEPGYFDILINRVEATLLVEARLSLENGSTKVCLLDRIHALTTAFEQALECEAAIRHRAPPRPPVRYAFHLDGALAVQNGLRAFFAMEMASAFWLLSAWPSGSGFVTTVAIVCALFSTRPDSAQAALGFLKGTALAALAATLCNFVLFPAISNFAALSLVISTFMIPAGMAMRSARSAAIGSAFAIFFWNFTALNNASRIGNAQFLNGALSTLLAIAFGTAMFVLVFPPNPRAARRRLHRAVRRDLLDIARHPHKWTASAYLSRAADRMSRELVLSRAQSQDHAVHALGDLLAAWTIGDTLLKMTPLAQRDPAARRAVELVRLRLAQGQFVRLAKTCESAARHIKRQPAIPGGDKQAIPNGTVLLKTMGDAVTAHLAFFTSEA
jgi:uncharacterized membrane protein YccC